jgi:DNA polymerase-1
MAAETLDVSLEVAAAMNQGYTDAFPMVVQYQEYVTKVMRKRGHCVNLYNRQYHLSDWKKHYTVANYLIQGSCADLLKVKMIEIDRFLTANKLHDKLRMILCIHDELQFEETTDKNMAWAVAEIQRIMENEPKIKVPIVADAEYTTTTWEAKEEIDLSAVKRVSDESHANGVKVSTPV